MDFNFDSGTITNVSTLNLTVASLDIVGTGGIFLPRGSIAERPSETDGYLRYNTETGFVEAVSGGSWVDVRGGTVTSVAIDAPAEFIVSGSPVASSGNLTLTKASQVVNTVWAGPAIGAAAAPTFRTISLAQNDLSDVTVTTPTVGQVLTYNGTKWANLGSASGPGGAAKRIWSGNVPSQTGTTIITPGVTPPLVTEGTQLWSMTVTPYATTASYVVQSNITAAASTNNMNLTLALFRNNVYIGGTLQIVNSSNNSATLSFSLTDLPNTTAPVTYQVRIGISANTWYVNRKTSENTYGGMNTGWVMWEY